MSSKNYDKFKCGHTYWSMIAINKMLVDNYGVIVKEVIGLIMINLEQLLHVYVIKDAINSGWIIPEEKLWTKPFLIAPEHFKCRNWCASYKEVYSGKTQILVPHYLYEISVRKTGKSKR